MDLDNTGGTRIRPWSALLFRDYRLLWGASLLNSLAIQIRNVSTLYQVYQLSGSPFKLGLTGFLEALPFIIFGLFAGAVADAFDRKKMLMATVWLQMVPSLMLGILTLLGRIGREKPTRVTPKSSRKRESIIR